MSTPETRSQTPSPDWSGFYKKSLPQRHAQLRQVFPGIDTHVLRGADLPCEVADVMIENCVGTISLPLGLGLNVVIEGQPFAVPMAVEEPSIIAAVSGAAKLIAGCGGFSARATDNIMISQVQVLDVPDVAIAMRAIERARDALMRAGDRLCPSMTRRGGGMVDVQARVLGPEDAAGDDPGDGTPLVVVHLHVNVCEAMGANVVNHIAEGLAPQIAELTGGRAGLRILTNLSTERRALASFRVPIAKLAWKGFDGPRVARQLMEAYRFAALDPYRAATHNKGIMNGIDAVAIATGQDWRAIEAGAHAYAVRRGRYGPLTRYSLDGDDFCGELELPMALGTKGGALGTHPTYRMTLGMLGNPSAQQLAKIMVAVGLAQNFAAIRALATEGIQRGHMSLHARNVAMAAGVTSDEVPAAVQFMVARDSIDRSTALAFLSHLRGTA